jgi:hypothetical protein
MCAPREVLCGSVLPCSHTTPLCVEHARTRGTRRVSSRVEENSRSQLGALQTYTTAHDVTGWTGPSAFYPQQTRQHPRPNSNTHRVARDRPSSNLAVNMMPRLLPAPVRVLPVPAHADTLHSCVMTQSEDHLVLLHRQSRRTGGRGANRGLSCVLAPPAMRDSVERTR